jgi:hypothetical protein
MERVRRALAVLVFAGVAACTGPMGATVSVPPSDTTPPVLTVLETLDRAGGQLSVTPTSGPVAGSWGGPEAITIAARVDDPEGAREIAIWGEGTLTCYQGEIASMGQPLLGGAIATNTDPASPGGTTQTGRVVTYVARLGDFDCPASDTGLHLELKFWAVGKNFGTGEARSETLTLTHTRGETP